MRLEFSERFKRQFADAPPKIQHAFDKQSLLLLQNLRHPSLRTKKYGGTEGVWQARVSYDWRFYFEIIGDAYYIISIRSHP
jgi:mRNA interferase RelE/StbE